MRKKMTTNERITLAISLVALIGSGISLWQNYKSSSLQQELARPLLAISEAHATTAGRGDNMLLSMKVQNSGSLTAFITTVAAKTDMDIRNIPNDPRQKQCALDFAMERSSDIDPKGIEIQPKATIGFFVTMPVPNGCATVWPWMPFLVDFTYHDALKNSYPQSIRVEMDVKKQGT